MASVTGASSLGNTSLRGFGGMASGIDRDAMIGQMTAGTLAKITRQKNAMTSISWKQESYQSVINKILDLQDNHFSYASGANLKDPMFYAKNQITAIGKADATRYITATGSSDMLDYVSIMGVKQLATSTTLMSAAKAAGSIKTDITQASLTNDIFANTMLVGRELRFGTYDNEGRFQSAGIFQFPTSYKKTEDDGTETVVNLDYVGKKKADGTGYDFDGVELAKGLNEALAQSNIKSGDVNISEVMEFKYENNKMNLVAKEGKTTNLVINSSSSALTALGYNPKVDDTEDAEDKDVSKGITLDMFNQNQKNFEETAIIRMNMLEYLEGEELTVSFGGQTKKLELVKKGDEILSKENPSLEELRDMMQTRLNQAFGKDNILVEINADSKTLEFKPANENQTLVIDSEYSMIRDTLGIQKGASNKLSVTGSIRDNIEKLIPDIKNPDGTVDEAATKAARDTFLADLDDENKGLVINGKRIAGVTSETSLKDMMAKINADKDAGVKASFSAATNQFILVAAETGKGRTIELGDVAKTIFGALGKDENGAEILVDSSHEGAIVSGSLKNGQNAEVIVSYGNGVTTKLESSSNTFDLEGLRVTVSGIFGDVEEVTDAAGKGTGVWESDTSMAVTFSAKADVDGVTEKVKKFIEEYNALVTEINTQITTKPNKSYGPLTEEQKAEMSETSIENWEKMAKQGLLFNDPTMRSLSMDIQSIMTSLLNEGVGYQELQEMGVTISEDYLAGGTIDFDEAKFKAAMTSNPEKVSSVFSGSGGKKGLTSLIETTMTSYATKYASRNGNSYGRLVEEAGSEKIPGSVMKNQIYDNLKSMQEVLDRYQEQLKNEQDRYIGQFTRMEALINQMNSQSNYLSQFQV